MRRHHIPALVLAAALPGLAIAQNRPPATARTPVTDISQLPRFAYPVSGDVGRFLDRPAELRPLAARLKSDLMATLTSHDIQDRATLGQLHRILRDIAILENDLPGFVRHNQLTRSFQDKPALATWLGIPEAARFAAANAAAPGSPAFAEAFRAALQSAIEKLDFSVNGKTVAERYRGLSTTGPGMQRGAVMEALQPAVDGGGTLDMNGLARLIAVANNLRDLLPLAEVEREVEAGWLAANSRWKPGIWEARSVTLSDPAKLTPVVIGIWDSGTDTQLFGSQAWTNRRETVNGRDDDGNGWVDDVHGIAIDVMGERAIGPLETIPAEFQTELSRLRLVSKGGADIQAGLDSPEAQQAASIFRTISAEDAKKLARGRIWYGGYVHGTHVAGIAVEGNPAARVLTARNAFDWRSPPRRPTEATARAFAQRHQDYVDYFKSHGVRVVNMSWTVGLKDEYEDQLIANGVRPEQAVVEGKRLFAIERQGLYEAIASAPDILFVAAAGNSNDSADFSGNAPSSFDLPNVLTVAALDQAGEPTNFTTSGKTIDLAASGYQVESVVPGGQRVRLSGTSMASPQVANAAAKLFAVRPELTVAQVRDLLISTATDGPGGFKQLSASAALAQAMVSSAP
jgi:subtilisin family serine protease